MSDPLTAIAATKIKEIAAEKIKEECIKPIVENTIVESQLTEQFDIINKSSLESLRAKNDVDIGNRIAENQAIIREISPYSDDLNKYIRNPAELNLYKNSELTGLKESLINNRHCLLKEDINLNIKDDFGKTNIERMQAGKAPIDEKGNPIELHHIGQKQDSPFAELRREEHHNKINYNVLHKIDESKINRFEFDKERAEHWKTRAKEFGG